MFPFSLGPRIKIYLLDNEASKFCSKRKIFLNRSETRLSLSVRRRLSPSWIVHTADNYLYKPQMSEFSHNERCLLINVHKCHFWIDFLTGSYKKASFFKRFFSLIFGFELVFTNWACISRWSIQTNFPAKTFFCHDLEEEFVCRSDKLGHPQKCPTFGAEISRFCRKMRWSLALILGWK